MCLEGGRFRRIGDDQLVAIRIDDEIIILQECPLQVIDQAGPAPFVHLTPWQRNLVNLRNVIGAAVIARMVDDEQGCTRHSTTIVVNPNRQIHGFIINHRHDCNIQQKASSGQLILIFPGYRNDNKGTQAV